MSDHSDDDAEDVVFLPGVVIDSGSGTCKIGFAGESRPRAVFPTVVCRTRREERVGRAVRQGRSLLIGTRWDPGRNFVGHKAEEKRNSLNLKYPIHRGIVVDWDDMEVIWHQSFYKELQQQPEDWPVTLTEPALNPRQNRENMTEMMFETFNVPKIYIAPQAMLSLYWAEHITGDENAVDIEDDHITGVAVEIGDGVTQIAPVYREYILRHATHHLNLAGEDLTDFLMSMLTERGYQFTTPAEEEAVRDIKEQLCYVSTDFKTDMSTAEKAHSLEKPFEMPNGQVIKVGSERFRCPELLFQPSLYGIDSKGIHEILYEAISKCEKNLWKELYSNIVLSGGSSMFPGIADRLRKELSDLVGKPLSKNIRIVEAPRREYSAWLGGSLLAASSEFENQFITKKKYDEMGSEIVHTKCFQ